MDLRRQLGPVLLNISRRTRPLGLISVEGILVEAASLEIRHRPPDLTLEVVVEAVDAAGVQIRPFPKHLVEFPHISKEPKQEHLHNLMSQQYPPENFTKQSVCNSA